MTRTKTLLTATLIAGLVPFLWHFTVSAQEPPARARKVNKTDAQWAKLLTNDQYLVTRQKATEPAFSGKYALSHAKGTYACVCCGAELFSSDAKFDSGTGWPSFWKPIDPKRIESASDFHATEPRIEVLCIDCGAHLGHVFNDGPLPTGLRFCINSASLKFKPRTVSAASSASKTKKVARPSGKAKTKPETTPPADPPTPDHKAADPVAEGK